MLFGFMFGKSGGLKINIGVADEDQTQASQQFIDQLRLIPVLKLEQKNSEALLEEINENKKNFAIIIKQGYEASLAKGGARIEVVYNQSQGPMQQVVISILQQIVDRTNWKLLQTEPPIQLTQTAIQPQRRDQSYVDFLLPGLIGMSVVSTSLFSIGMVVVAYREKGKLRRLSVTPLPKTIFIAGQIVNRYFIVLVQAFLLMTLATLIFDVQIVGSLVDFLAALTIGMLAFIALGFLVASVANTTETASGIANTLFLPMIFLSGVYFSVEGIPKFLKPLVEFLPLTHLVRAIRGIFTNGISFMDVLPQMGILSIWMIVCFAISVKLFRWE
ncbi:MAG: ABC transporter permease, partial [bacterium]